VRGEGPRALVVEADPELRAQLAEALAARGMRVLVAGSGREALAALERTPPQVAVISAALPGMSGFDLAKSARRQAGPGELALIIVTDVAWAPAQKAAVIQQIKLHDLLVLPLEPGEIAASAAAALLVRAETREPSASGAAARAQQRSPVEVDESEEGDRGGLADPASREEQREVERQAEGLQAAPSELRGNLSATPFPRLLHALYKQRATGGLFLLRDTIKKIVYFKDGHPSYIKSNLLSECLGKVLVREGLITEAQCKESLRLMKENHRQQGTVLVELGVISPQNLVVGLELQLRAKLMDIFTWTRGEYLFKNDARVPIDVIRLDVSAATLITDGIRGCWEAARLEEELASSWDRHLVPNPDPELRFQELSLTEDEQALLDAVDGVRTLRQLIAESALPPARAMAICYALIVTGVVEPREEPCSQEPLERRPGRALSPEEPLREQLAQQLLSLRQRDAYGVLGVSAASGDASIEQAYSSLAREYHPDRFRGASPDTRTLADEIFGLIYQAYRQIATQDQRQRYRRRYTTEELREVSASGGDTLVAERLRREALELVAAARWAEALVRLDRAVALRPEAGDILALHAWAVYQADPSGAAASQRAIRELRHAIELDPKHHLSYLHLGRVYAAMGKAILAEKQFEKAIQCKPDCEEALEELRKQRERRPPRRRPART